MKTTKRLYQFITDNSDGETCEAISKEACEVVPRNFIYFLFTQFLTKLSDALASTKIVLPWLMSSIGVPAVLIGMLVPIRESGSLIPQVLLGGVVRRYKVRKWSFVLGCALQALSVAAIAFAATIMQGLIAGLVILALLILFSLSRGLSSIASKDVMGKTIPKARRGQLGGLSASAAGGVTIGVGVALILGFSQNAVSAVWLLAFASTFWLFAAWIFSRIDEDDGERDTKASVADTAVRSMDLLRTDSLFRNFVMARCFMLASALAAPYLVMLAQTHGHGKEDDIAGYRSLALFILVNGVASLISGRIWGRYADVSSRKVMLIASSCTSILCALSCVVAVFFDNSSALTFVGLYFVLAIIHQGVRLGRKTYVVDMADGNKRTDYVTVSNTIVGLVLLAIGLVGALTAHFSLGAVLGFYAVASAVGAIASYALDEV